MVGTAQARLCPPYGADLLEQHVDVVLRRVARIALIFWAVQIPAVVLTIDYCRWRVGADGIDAAPDIHHDRDVAFDDLHRVHPLADALAGEILKVASLEDREHTLGDFIA